VNEKVKIKYDDNIIFEGLSHLSFEAEGTNIQVEHLKGKGFSISVYDKQRKIMHYYDVVDGKLKLSSKENVETGEEMLIRDDIKDKVIELLLIEFPSQKEVNERTYFKDIDLEAMDIRAFADTIAKEFEIEEIPVCQVMQWQTVKDIVCYLDNALEDATIGDDAEEEW